MKHVQSKVLKFIVLCLVLTFIIPMQSIFATASVKVQYMPGVITDGNSVRPYLKLVNTGTASLTLSTLKLRYWYTKDGTVAENFSVDYNGTLPGGTSAITGAFVEGAKGHYMEIGFTSATGSLAPGADSGQMKLRANKSDFSNYSQTDDYSFDSTIKALTDWSKVTLYENGILVWGTEPGGGTPTPTPTPAPTPTPSGLDPNVAPGGNFDLSIWKLQLPIGTSGSPTTISASQLQGPNGFQDTYFYTDKTNGSMAMMDPTTGVTTSGSLHPRTELREDTTGWSTSGTNILSTTAQVTVVPDHVCIGQIFQAPSSPSKPLLELMYYNGGTIKVMIEATNQGGDGVFYSLGSVSSGSKFTYSLSLSGTTITITINGTAHNFTLPSTFVGENFYFKAGDYDQTAVSGTPGTTPGTLVKFYSLNVTHK
jgi:hypothetical protein